MDSGSSITAIEYYNSIDDFQQNHGVDSVHSITACANFWVDARRELYCHDAARIDVGTITERLGQRAAVCLVDFARRVVQIRNLIHPGVGFIVQSEVKVEELA